MQLYAFKEGICVLATHAEKGRDYLCPECGCPVRIRSGPHRQIHFYHLRLSKNCRQSGKSEEHLRAQLYLLDLLKGEAQMETHFPSIGRIADIAWHTRKIVFEVQCSSISLSEAKARISDYRSLGYETVFILHEKKFNRKNVSAAEIFLRSLPCYFINSDKKNVNKIYDQFDLIQGDHRLFKGPPLIVSVDKIFSIPSDQIPQEIPLILKQRLKPNVWSAEGDLLYRVLQGADVQQMLFLENRSKEKKTLSWSTLLCSAYRCFLDFLLKKC